MRGKIININEINFLCMGGAISTDKAYRKENISWWKEEEPSYKEWEKAFMNLSEADVILSHDSPYNVIKQIKNVEKNNINAIFNRMLEFNTNAKKWYFAHHHINKNIKYKNVKFEILYNKIKKI